VRVTGGILAGLVLLQLGVGLWRLTHVPVMATGDPAWYFVVARNFAEGRGLTDTVLWTYLGNPEPVSRPAGAYWQIGWPLILGGLMQVAGHLPSDAMRISVILSSLVPVLVFWIALRAFAGNPWPAGLAGLLCVLQMRLWHENVNPNVTVPYQIAVLLALAAVLALLRAPTARSVVMAGLALALPAYLRVDGLVPLAAAVVVVLGWADAPRGHRVLLAAGMATIAAVALAPLAAYTVHTFGTLVPEPRRLAPWMTSYVDLFRYPCPVSEARWHADPARWSTFWQTLRVHLGTSFSDHPVGLAPLGIAGLVTRVLPTPTRAAIGIFLLASMLVPPLAAPAGANAARFLFMAAPLLCIPAAAAIAWLWTERRWRVAALVLTVACVIPRLDMVKDAEGGEIPPGFLWSHLRHADLNPEGLPRLRPEDVVISEDSWRVAAYLDVAAMQSPFPALDAFAALQAYRPGYAIVDRGGYLEGLLRRIQPSPLRVIYRDGQVTWYAFMWPARPSR